MSTPHPRNRRRVMLWIAMMILSSGAIGASVALAVQNRRLARAAADGNIAELRLDRLTESLGLSETQRARIRPILEHGQEEIRMQLPQMFPANCKQNYSCCQTVTQLS